MSRMTTCRRFLPAVLNELLIEIECHLGEGIFDFLDVGALEENG